MKHLILTLAILSLPITATSQITHLPNTGCQNAGQTPIGGSTSIGQQLFISSTQLPCNSPGTSGFILLNTTCLVAPPLALGCFNNPCVILLPDVILSKPISYNLTVNIPNNVALIGVPFCAQGGCLSTFGGRCLFPLNLVARVRITR